MAQTLASIRYTLRGFLQRPGFTCVAVATLALGIGANTAMFSVVNEMLLRPVPHAADEDQLVMLRRAQPQGTYTDGFSHLGYIDYRDHSTAFTGLTAYVAADLHLGEPGRVSRVAGELVTGEYFSVLGIQPGKGRFIGPEDNRVPGGHAVAVVSHRLWQEQFGSDPQMVGRTIRLNGHPFTLIGIAPDSFRGPMVFGDTDVWIPHVMEAIARPKFQTLNSRLFTTMEVIARLKPGVRREQAQAEMDLLASRFEQEENGAKPRVIVAGSIRMVPEWRSETQHMLAMVMAIVGLVLLVACANVANMLAARAWGRRREFAIRAAVGARTADLVRLFLSESILLALAGGFLGLLITPWIIEGIRLIVPDSGLETTADLRVLAFTFTVAVLSGSLFGLAPAWNVRRQDIVDAMKDGGAGSGYSRSLLRNGLVVAQFALSTVVIVAAVLFTRTLIHLQSVNPGFNAEGAFFTSFDLRTAGYSEPKAQQFYNRALEVVSAQPYVASATVADDLPLGFMWDGRIERDGLAPVRAGRSVVGRRYFETLQIPFAAGRDFEAGDTRGAPAVAVINEAAARYLWPGEPSLGRTFRFHGGREAIEVVGVVRDGKYEQLSEQPMPFVYLPAEQSFEGDMQLIVRARGDATAAVSAIRPLLAGLDPNLPARRVTMLSDHVTESLGWQRINSILITAFGCVAVLLAATGLYAVVSYTVARRTRDIGIRIALGASSAGVVRVSVLQGLKPALAGMVIGLGAAGAITPAIRSQLHGITAADPLSFGAAACLLILIALTAAYLPARRALRVDPVQALRAE